MSDDYLWDPSAKPDPEVERLERALRPLRYVEKREPAEAARPIPITAARRRRAGFTRWILLAAALCALGAAGTWFFARSQPPPIEAKPPPRETPRDAPQEAPRMEETTPRLAVERLEGAPKVGPSPIAQHGALAVGQWLETDA